MVGWYRPEAEIERFGKQTFNVKAEWRASARPLKRLVNYFI